MNQAFKRIHTSAQAHPVLLRLTSFEVEFPQYTQMCVSCQVFSSERSICGGRNEESGKGWLERGGGLKGEGKAQRLFNSKNP